jgi:hypothetical protein
MTSHREAFSDGEYPGLLGSLDQAHNDLFGPALRGYMIDALFSEMEPLEMVKMYDGDYEFGCAAQFDKSYRNLASETKTSDYRIIAEAFARNMERVVSINALPIELIYWSSLHTRIACIARSNSGLPIAETTLHHTEEFRAEYIKVFKEQMQIKSGKTRKDSADEAWAEGTAFLKKKLRPEIENTNGEITPYLRAGIEAILASMLTSSYAAFEALASDLWVSAVNKHTELAKNWTEANSNKAIEFSQLVGHEFDLSKSMGTVLSQSQKVSFLSSNDFFKAYKDAFAGEVDNVFEPKKDLMGAEQIRHLLAHRGGQIDKKFKDKMKDFPEYSNLTIDYLPLDGPSVLKHIGACVKCATGLYRAVDDWSAAR